MIDNNISKIASIEELTKAYIQIAQDQLFEVQQALMKNNCRTSAKVRIGFFKAIKWGYDWNDWDLYICGPCGTGWNIIRTTPDKCKIEAVKYIPQLLEKIQKKANRKKEKIRAYAEENLTP